MLDSHEKFGKIMSGNGDYPEPAFAVGKINEDFDPLIPPATGEEYIQRVVLEASKCENVLVASVDKSLFKEQTVNIDVSIKEPPLVTPSIEWQQCQVADFSSVRHNLARYRSLGIFKPCISLPARIDEAGWYLMCFGSDTEPVESGGSGGGVPPLLSILLSMNQSLIHQVLEYHVEWLEAKSSLSVHQGQWLYSLLACLELPLLPETCSLLRTLARECSRLRASLKSVDAPSMAPLTLMICLVANYFRQMDLADTLADVAPSSLGQDSIPDQYLRSMMDVEDPSHVEIVEVSPSIADSPPTPIVTTAKNEDILGDQDIVGEVRE